MRHLRRTAKMDIYAAQQSRQLRRVICAADSQWSTDGNATIGANRALMEMLATQLLPFNLVDGVGFQQFVGKLQPKYKIPSRHYFPRYELPFCFEAMKCIKEGLRSIEEEERLKNLLENVKRFVRKVRKSRVLTEQLAELQQKEEAISFGLREDKDNRFSNIKKTIANAIELRLKQAEEQKNLVLATILDPRFKTIYLDSSRLNQYKDWQHRPVHLRWRQDKKPKLK
ncbi:hypothetical protein niasHT_020873 [Heterodera trifolii]|uniref:Uncharacterized protein n=1 Tax=Heterodera trifolii TaxID=157864 RepID=A0ABD2JU18_9BILA